MTPNSGSELNSRSTKFFRLWNSPTITTWAAFAATGARILLPLPFILLLFPTEEVALWYLLVTLAQLIQMFDFGFNITTSRYFAYAAGGAIDYDNLPAKKLPGIAAGGESHRVLELQSVVARTYWFVGLAGFLIMGIAGTALLARPISYVNDPQSAWAAWAFILVGSTIRLSGGAYSAFLQGSGYLPLLRRWEAFTNLGAALTISLLAIGGFGLLVLAAGFQIWTVVAVLGNRYFSRRKSRRFLASGPQRYNQQLAASIWQKAWRSGIGVLLNLGVVRLTGPLLAQVVDPVTLASYLIAYSLLDYAGQFSRAPFYSKIPVMAKLFGQGQRREASKLASRGMVLSLGTFAFAIIVIGPLADWLLMWFNTPTPFIGLYYWAAISVPFGIYLLGAMHLQLYTLTNHVVWHIADSISGALYVVTFLVSFDSLRLYAVPVALMVGYGGFYTFYAMWHSRTVWAADVEENVG